MSFYTDYLAAKQRIESGWIRGQYHDGAGGYCIVGSLQVDKGYMPAAMILQVAAEMERYRLFRWAHRIVRSKADYHINDTQHTIEMWNDMPWRRKETVEDLFARLVAKESEVFIAELRAERDALEARIVRLEAENASLWKRLLNARAIDEDRKALAAMDDELDAIAREHNLTFS